MRSKGWSNVGIMGLFRRQKQINYESVRFRRQTEKMRLTENEGKDLDNRCVCV